MPVAVAVNVGGEEESRPKIWEDIKKLECPRDDCGWEGLEGEAFRQSRGGIYCSKCGAKISGRNYKRAKRRGLRRSKLRAQIVEALEGNGVFGLRASRISESVPMETSPQEVGRLCSEMSEVVRMDLGQKPQKWRLRGEEVAEG